MSLRQDKHYARPLLIYVAAIISLVLCSASVLAQEQPTPKAELFVGYQWLNPGGKVPLRANCFCNPGGKFP